MKNYIFITEEEVTYQPNSTSPEPDIENCQVIGFKPIKNRTRFIAFEEVSRWHAKSYELMLTESKIYGNISGSISRSKE